MQGTIRARLKEKSGKSVEEWVLVVKKSGLAVRKERVAWLMEQHGLGRVAANIVAAEAEGAVTDYSQGDKLIETMFAGAKAGLRPIYDRVAAAARNLGADVSVCPCKTQVTFKRKRQFAWVKPAAAGRLDLGLALPDVAAGGPLQDIPGTNDGDRVRLRIPLAAEGDVDAEVLRWLKIAYKKDA
jgi:hypothetical protein